MTGEPDREKVLSETDYIVDDDPPLRLTIGEQNDGARILFASFNVESGAFVTAWNPGGKSLDYAENLDRQADLLEKIEQLRLNYFVGRAEHPDQGSAKDAYFVLGMTRAQAIELGREFGQTAIVWVSMSGTPELVPIDGD